MANYYGILPANVRYDKNLKPMEKILYTEITALTNKNGYCNATNGYFAKLYDVHKNTVGNWINNLVKYGYLKSVLFYDEQNTQRRKLYIMPINENIGINENVEGYQQKDCGGINENVEGVSTKTLRNNNTSIILQDNNNSNNNLENNKPEKNIVVAVEEPKEKDLTGPLTETGEININPVLRQEIRMLLGTRKIDVQKIIEFHKPIARIKQVIDYCNAHNKSNGYLLCALRDDYELYEPKKREEPYYPKKTRQEEEFLF